MKALDLITPEELVKEANDKGRSFTAIKTNQIRNFFSAVVSVKNKVQMMGNKFEYSKIETDLFLLKPKLAYAAGRQPVVKPFKIFMDDAIDALQQSKDKKLAVENFFHLIESVVAYHKFYGGN